MANPIQKPILSIVIPTVGRGEILRNTLEAVFKATSDLDVEVVLVDDSKTGSVESFGLQVNLIRSGGIGASGARNKGWRVAKSDLLLFLDDDILIRPEHIRQTLELHQTPSDKAYNFFWVYPPHLMDALPKTKFGRYILDHKLYSNEHRLGYGLYDSLQLVEEKGLTSQYFSIEKRWMEEVAGYDSILYAGVEDLLLYKKLNKVGVSVYLSLKDVVYQDESNRLQFSSLVSRYCNGALTRRVAVERGHPEMGVHMGLLARTMAIPGLFLEPIVRSLSHILPYGKLYQKAVNFQLFMGTYRGYYRDKLPREFAKGSNGSGR